MGIDRHEWDHRNYKSGRAVAAPAALADDDGVGDLGVDASLGEAPPQPETAKPSRSRPSKSESTSKSEISKSGISTSEPSKVKAKAAPKEVSKVASNKGPSKTTSGGKRPARTR